MTLDRSYPYKPFDETLIEPFLRGRGVRSVELLGAGKINSNYKIELSDGLMCVLRLYSRGDPAREAYVMDLVRDIAPVPSELGRGDGWSVVEFLDGALLEEAPRQTDAAAEALVRIGSIEFEAPGMINEDGTITRFDFGGKGFVRQQLENTEVLRWIGRDIAEEVVSALDRETQRSAEINAESRLVHGDFNPTNVLVRDGVVTGVLDWEFCMSGTPYMDIGNLLRNTDRQYHDLIENGLRTGGMNLPEDWIERAELVDVGSPLASLTSARSDEFKRQCVARIERFVRMFSHS